MDDIEKINGGTPEMFDKLKKGVLSNDSEIRQRSFSKLTFFEYDERIQNILIQGLKDKDEFIRSDCVEYLAEYDLTNNLDEVIRSLNDKSYYVVYSSVISLAEIENNIDHVVNILAEKLKESDLQSGILLRIHFALYKLDSTYDINNILNCYSNSKDYRDRCAILNLLSDYCRESEITLVTEKLKKLVDLSDFKSVLSDYENLIESLSE